ncbi:MAG: hypothetical protein ACHP7N_08050 [Caulobacterales bacterium]
MIRVLLASSMLLACAACAGGGDSSDNPGPGGRAWYESGDATYDALKAATEACKQQGGDFHLKNGGDPTHMGDYQCAKGKGG